MAHVQAPAMILPCLWSQLAKRRQQNPDFWSQQMSAMVLGLALWWQMTQNKTQLVTLATSPSPIRRIKQKMLQELQRLGLPDSRHFHFMTSAICLIIIYIIWFYMSICLPVESLVLAVRRLVGCPPSTSASCSPSLAVTQKAHAANLVATGGP